MKKEEKPQEIVLCNENPFFGLFFMKKCYKETSLSFVTLV